VGGSKGSFYFCSSAALISKVQNVTVKVWVVVATYNVTEQIYIVAMMV
jgi:hypothetical protein